MRAYTRTTQSNYLPQCDLCKGLWPSELHAHAHVRAYVCVHACVCTCEYVCVRASMCVCVRASMCVCTCVCVRLCACAYVCVQCVHVCECIRLCTCVRMYTVVYIRVCVRVRLCTRTWCVHAHVKGLKTPSWCPSSPRKGQPPKLFVHLGGLEGWLGRLSRPVPVHA